MALNERLNLIMKPLLRNRILAERKALTPDQVFTLSLAIFSRLKDYLRNTSFESLLAYYPIHNEVDTTLMFDYFWEQKKTLFLPVIKDTQLHPVLFTPDSTLKEGVHHIPIPDSPSDEQTPRQIDVAIVPCLACDRNRFRLGYGKGYYDRFLSAKTLKIGLCYDFQLVDKLPAEPHDIRLDVIVTDQILLKSGV